MSQKRNDDPLGLSDIQSDVTDQWSDQPFESGFTWKVVLGAVFIAVVMLPGLIYMGLMVGMDIGSGADWVTVLLFLELSRRSYQKLKRQELMIINHMCNMLTQVTGGAVLGGGVFASLIWQQYLKRSEAFENFNLTEQMPGWFAPPIEILSDRTFFNEAWTPAILVALVTVVLHRMQFFGVGYLVFRITNDVERLPFPLARIGAEGTTALAESDSKDGESWRWSVFSLMGVVGAVWGLIYMGIPTISSVLFGVQVELIPIPFLDLTPYTESFLPSAATAVGFNLGIVLSAFVIPKRVIIGSVTASLICQVLLPPIFYHYGIHSNWERGFGALDTQIANGLDVWISVGIGGALSVAITGIWMAFRATRKNKKEAGPQSSYDWSRLWNPPEGRGDLPLWACFLCFIVSGLGFVYLVHAIVNLGMLGGFAKPKEEWFPIWILLLFAFVWTPLTTYIHARLIGIAGQNVSIPFVREGAFFMSGYKHPDIWQAPLPINDFGGVSNLFKQIELTRVKFSSLILVELFSLVVLTLAGFFYWSYLWGLGPVPSDAYPYAKEMWPFIAKQAALWTSALGEGNDMMISAIQPDLIAGSCAGFTLLFGLFSWLGIPLAYYFGAVGGVGQFPYIALTMLLGLFLRFAVAKRLGEENLKRYAPVMMAGFGAGFGITGMLVVALVLGKSAVSALMY